MHQLGNGDNYTRYFHDVKRSEFLAYLRGHGLKHKFLEREEREDALFNRPPIKMDSKASKEQLIA